MTIFFFFFLFENECSYINNFVFVCFNSSISVFYITSEVELVDVGAVIPSQELAGLFPHSLSLSPLLSKAGPNGLLTSQQKQETRFFRAVQSCRVRPAIKKKLKLVKRFRTEQNFAAVKNCVDFLQNLSRGSVG